MKITIEFPQVGRRRLVGTGALCSAATTLWIAAPAYLPFAVVSLQHVVVGVLVPFGVGWVTLLLMERRIVRELQPAARRRMPEHDRVGAR